MSTREERHLIRAAQQGDSRAFDRLVHRYQGQIYRAMTRACANPELAQDVLQEAMIRAFRALPQFRGDASFATWLFRIAKNLCVRKQQQMLAHPTVSLDQPLSEEEDAESLLRQMIDYSAQNPQQVVLDEEIRQKVREAVDKLPPNLREILILRDMEDLSNQETAERTGLTVAAVKARLHRARALLREHLEEYFSDS
ncbi:MAG: sigma-70 family RNA polymerase sigma factor [Armatimonadota bacterium]|nr:sigma-70 family RNA polymerase sigma factor [Armatimonadota bacterium]MDW8291113.1 sigma-70 family RNA polymerase sigma factor [Armatimonadota bacterium]